MRYLNNAKTIIIFILLGIIIWLSQCNNSQPFISFGSDCPEIKDTITVVRHDTIHPDTQFVEVEVPKPYPVREIVQTEKIKYVFRDSAAIDSLLQAFFTLRHYQDTISDDSLEIIVEEKVVENEISEREVRYRLLFPVISTTKNTFTNYVSKRRNQFYIGGILGPAFPEEVGFQYGLKLTFVGKKNYMVGLSYSRLQSTSLNTNFLHVEYSRLITFRKKG